VASVPKGKTVYFIHHNVPLEVLEARSARRAGETLGWKVKPLQVEPSPEAVKQAYTTAVNDPSTSAIISTDPVTATVGAQLHEAAAKHIPVVVEAPQEQGPDHLSVGGPPMYLDAGKLEADYVLKQTRGRGQVLITIPAVFPSQQNIARGFKDEWAKMCPRCQAPLMYGAPATSLGKDFPALLTASLQAHRSVNYIVFGFNDMMIGVPEALKAAGLGGVKAITWAQGPETNSLIGAGMLEADLSVPVTEFPWVAMDTVLRTFNHQSVAQASAWLGPGNPMRWFMTKAGLQKAGVPLNEMFPVNADYQEQFKKLWGLTN
jgi:ribose transport system substrate-binding protein